MQYWGIKPVTREINLLMDIGVISDILYHSQISNIKKQLERILNEIEEGYQ
jgi:hypothetical protein